MGALLKPQIIPKAISMAASLRLETHLPAKRARPAALEAAVTTLVFSGLGVPHGISVLGDGTLLVSKRYYSEILEIRALEQARLYTRERESEREREIERASERERESRSERRRKREEGGGGGATCLQGQQHATYAAYADVY